MNNGIVIPTKESEAHFKVNAEIAVIFREAVRHKYGTKSHGMMQVTVEKALLYYKKHVLDDYFESGLEVKEDGIRVADRSNTGSAADRR